MIEPHDLTPEQADKLLKSILDPNGLSEMRPDDPLPIALVLYNAGYFEGASKAEKIVSDMMQLSPDMTPEDAKTVRAMASATILEFLESGTLERFARGALVEAAYASDDATLAALVEAGVPEWNEHLGDKFRDGHMAAFLDVLEQRLTKIRKENT
jgi:hypothetical protein